MALSSYGTPMGKVLGIRGDVREGRGGQPDRLGKVGGEKRGEAERYENDVSPGLILSCL